MMIYMAVDVVVCAVIDDATSYAPNVEGHNAQSTKDGVRLNKEDRRERQNVE